MSNVMGSIKNKIVAKDLQDERNNCNFDRAELKTFLYGSAEF